MQIADGRCESIDARRLNKSSRAVWRRKGFLDFLIIDVLSMNVRAAAKIMRLRLNQRASELGVLDDLAGFGDNFLIRCVVISLRNVNVDELVARVNRPLAALDRRAMIEVEIHLDAVFFLVIINHVADIIQAHGLDLAVRNFDQHWRLQFLRRSRHGDQRFLVVDIKRADRKMLRPGALHQMPRPRRIMPNFRNCQPHVALPCADIVLLLLLVV